MDKELHKDLLEQVTASQGDNLIKLLDVVKNEIADARNGDYSVEARKCAIESLDKHLYNVVKQGLQSKPKKGDKYFSEMI